MSKHIQFTRDVGDYKVGQFSEVADVVASQFINMNVAKPAPEDLAERSVAMASAQMIASIEATAQKQREELQAALKALAIPSRDFAKPKHVTGAGEWQDPTSEVDKKRSAGKWFRNVVRAQLHRDVEAHRELVTSWDEGGYGCMVNDGADNYSRGMVEGIGSTGGYTTPTLYEQQVFEVAAEQSVLIQRCEVKPLGARQVEYPALNQYLAPTKGQAAWFGGMQVFRKTENAQRSERDIAFKKIQLLAMDLTAYTELSRDLVQDSTIPIDTYVVRMMGDAIGWREDWECFNGSGDGQFLGILNSPALVSYTRHTYASFPTYNAPINYADVFGMKSRMVLGARDPVWFCHPFTIPILEGLTSPSGAFAFVANTAITTQGPPGGSPAGGITFRPSGYLLGYPVFGTEKLPPPSTSVSDATHTYGPANQLLFVDCKSYWIGRRAGLEVGLSEHFKFDTDQLAIRAKVRNDGKPGQLAPVTLADGAATANQVSAFVSITQGVEGA